MNQCIYTNTKNLYNYQVNCAAIRVVHPAEQGEHERAAPPRAARHTGDASDTPRRTACLAQCAHRIQHEGRWMGDGPAAAVRRALALLE